MPAYEAGEAICRIRIGKDGPITAELLGYDEGTAKYRYDNKLMTGMELLRHVMGKVQADKHRSPGHAFRIIGGEDDGRSMQRVYGSQRSSEQPKKQRVSADDS